MVNRIIKGLVTAGAFWLINRYRQASIDLVKLEAATCYLKAIQSGRQTMLSALLVWLCVFFFALGVLILHASLFIGLYIWFQSMTAVAAGMLVLGGVYVIVILFAARRLFSEKAWMKFFKADKLVEELTKKT